jgi:hypothetical protein
MENGRIHFSRKTFPCRQGGTAKHVETRLIASLPDQPVRNESETPVTSCKRVPVEIGVITPPPLHLLTNNTVYLQPRPLTGRYSRTEHLVRRRSVTPFAIGKRSAGAVYTRTRRDAQIGRLYQSGSVGTFVHRTVQSRHCKPEIRRKRKTSENGNHSNNRNVSGKKDFLIDTQIVFLVLIFKFLLQ